MAQKRMPRVLLVLSLLSSVFASCATTTEAAGSSRMVTIDGATVSAEDQARLLLEAGNAAANSKDDVAAERAYADIVDNYSDTLSYAAAAVSLARLRLDHGDAAAAQRTLEALLQKEPSTPYADDARYLLALCQLKTGTSTSDKNLAAVVNQLPAAERPKAALELADKLVKEGQGTAAARVLSEALSTASDVDKPMLERRLFEVVDGQVPFADVRLLQETAAKPGSLLDELTTFKLARVHLHLRDYKNADAQLQRYLSRYPGGRFAADASAMQQTLTARLDVDPRAIGVLLPLSGEYAAYGKRALTALKIGFGIPVKADAPAEPQLDPDSGEPIVVKKVDKNLEEIVTTPGGIKLIIKDTKGDPNRAAQLVTALVAEHRVIGVVGDILLDTAVPIALAAEDASVVLLSLSRKEGVPETGPNTFRLALTARKQAEALASATVDGMGMKRFAIMYPKHAFGVELMNAFWDALDRRKVEVTAVESYAHDQTTFTAETKSLVGRGTASSSEQIECRRSAEGISNDYRRKKARESCNDLAKPIVDFEALFIPDSYRSVSYVVPALVAEDVLVTKDRRTVEAFQKTTGSTAKPVQLLGVNMWNDPELVKRLGRQIDGAILVDGFSALETTPRVQKFVAAFAAVHQGRPQIVEAQAHDAGALMRAVLSGEGGPAPKSREALRQQLSAVKDFPGVTGLVSFDGEGDSTTALHYFVVDGDVLEARELSKIVGEGKPSL